MTIETLAITGLLLGLPLWASLGIHIALDDSLPAPIRLIGLCQAPPAMLLAHGLLISVWPELAQC